MVAIAEGVADGIAADPTAHVEWARRVARGVAKAFRFAPASQEEAELEGEALLAMVGRSRAYIHRGGRDPLGAFRGYAYSYVRSQCVREARRIRNGGTYRTRREADLPPVEVSHLSVMKTPAGDPVELVDLRSLDTDPE